MKAVQFTEQNMVFAAEQKPYIPLPAYRDDEGMVVTCWKCESWREWLRMIFTGRVWLLTLTFNEPLQPLKLDAESPFQQ